LSTGAFKKKKQGEENSDPRMQEALMSQAAVSPLEAKQTRLTKQSAL
jgi:hypothetical protein